jgi:hypothetical protein
MGVDRTWTLDGAITLHHHAQQCGLTEHSITDTGFSASQQKYFVI